MQKIKLGKYKHYKGKKYEVIGVARHSETLKELVIYKPLYNSNKSDNNILWARPIDIFLENVKINDKKIPRFTFIK